MQCTGGTAQSLLIPRPEEIPVYGSISSGTHSPCSVGRQALRSLPGVGILFAVMGQSLAAIVANLIGGLILFWVDQFIFYFPVACCAVGGQREHLLRGLRQSRAGVPAGSVRDYDKSNDAAPGFRCEECSKKKTEALRGKGIKVE